MQLKMFKRNFPIQFDMVVNEDDSNGQHWIIRHKVDFVGIVQQRERQ